MSVLYAWIKRLLQILNTVLKKSVWIQIKFNRSTGFLDKNRILLLLLKLIQALKTLSNRTELKGETQIVEDNMLPFSCQY